jgi:hypothetical protein
VKLIIHLHVVPRLMIVKYALEQAMKAQRGSRGTAQLFNFGARWEGWSTPRPGRFTPGKETQYPLCRRLGGPPTAALEGCGKSRPIGIRSPDRPLRNKSGG